MKIHDFRKGPVWDEKLQRHVCDFRLPNGRRIKKRFNRERQAVEWWKREMRSIDDGTWNEEPPPKTLGEAFDCYRRWARVHCLAFKTIDSALKRGSGTSCSGD